MSGFERQVNLRLSVQRALLGRVSSAISAVSCGFNDNDIVLEFLVDPEFSDEDRERMEVVAAEVIADFADETITTVFTSPSTDGPRVPIAERWWAYGRFEPDALSIERKLEWPFVVQILTLVDNLFQQKASWPELIKQIRGASGVDILTAEKIALSHNGWRRLCTYRINHDPECKKQAAYHIKIHGSSSLILSVGGSFLVAEPEPRVD